MNRLSSFALTFIILAAGAGRACDASENGSLASINNVKVANSDIGECLNVSFGITNDSSVTLQLSPLNVTFSDIVLAAPPSWVPRSGMVPKATSGELTLDSFSIVENVLSLDPGESIAMTIDLRDFFEKIDLSDPTVKIKFRLRGSRRNGEYSTSFVVPWEGVVAIPVTVKGTTVEM